MHRDDFGTQQFHAEDVGLLTLDVGGAHINDARQVEEGTGGSGRHPMLTGAGLGDDAALAHAPREQDLAKAIVYLVGAGVVELVTLQIELRPAEMPGQPLGKVERARSPDIMFERMVELGLKARILARLSIGGLDSENQRHQSFGNKTTAIDAEMPTLVRPAPQRVGDRRLHAHPSARAAAMKARILPRSFRPGRLSTPEETSTILAPEIRTASGNSS